MKNTSVLHSLNSIMHIFICIACFQVTDSEIDNVDKERVYDEVYKSILDELVDDAMWELCFEVHKAVKLGYFFLDPDPEKYEFYVIVITIQDILKSFFKEK